MYMKRAYVVPDLNEGDGILLYIPKNTKGMYTAGDEPRPLSVDKVELYEVTKLTDWHDYVEFTATKVSRNTTAQETITGSYVDDGLTLQEPENLRYCPAAHIGARVQAKEPGYDDRFLYVPYRKRDMRIAKISYIYADGVSYIPDMNAFSITADEVKLLKNFYEDNFSGSLNHPDEDTAKNVEHVLDMLNLASQEYKNFLPREAFNTLAQLIESADFKKSRDILGTQLWEDRERLGYVGIDDYQNRDARFLEGVSPYDYSGDEVFEFWRDDAEIIETTINYLKNRLGDLERISIGKLPTEEQEAVTKTRVLLNTLIGELEALEYL